MMARVALKDSHLLPRNHGAGSSDIVAGARQTINISHSNRIADIDEYDWNIL